MYGASTARPRRARAGTRLARLLPALAGEALLDAFFVLEPRLRQGEQARSLDAGAADRGTTKTLAGAFVASALGAPALAALPRGRLSPRWGWVGVAVMAGGISLRVWSARTLGTSYTRTLRVSDEQALVDTGPYLWVRHPGYAGMLMTWLGYGLSWTSFPAVAVSTAPMLLTYTRRIAAEETLLEHRLGPAYREYRQRTARLIPGIY